MKLNRKREKKRSVVVFLFNSIAFLIFLPPCAPPCFDMEKKATLMDVYTRIDEDSMGAFVSFGSTITASKAKKERVYMCVYK